MIELRKHLAESVKWNIGANAGVAVINFAGLLLFARVLGPEVIAQYGMAVVLVDVLAALLGFGFNQAIIRDPDDAGLYRAAFLAICIQSATLMLLGGLAYLILAYQGVYQGAALWFTLCVARTALFFGTLFYAHLEARLAYRDISLLQLIAALASTAVGLLVATVQDGVGSLAIRDGLYAACVVSLSARVAPLRFLSGVVHRTSIEQLWQFAKEMWKLNLLERLAVRLEYVLVSRALLGADFGVYFAVRGLVEGVLGLALKPIQTVVYSYYCRAASPRTSLRTLLRRVLPGLLIGTSAACGFVLSIGSGVVEFTLGARYGAGSPLLLGLAIYVAGAIWFELQKVLAMSSGHHAVAVWGRLAQVVTVVLFAVLVLEPNDFHSAGLLSGTGAVALAVVISASLLIRLHRTA